MECIKRFRDIALDYYDHCEERTLVEMCMTNMIRECRAVLEKLEISQFAQLLQKVRKIAQSVKLSSDKRNTSQVVTVSTGERRRKTDGREYDTPPPILCTQRSQMCSQTSRQQTESLSLIKFLGSPQKRSEGIHASTVCTTTCNIRPKNVRRFADQCTIGSKKGLQNYLSKKFNETHSQTIKGRVQQQQ